MRILHIAQMTRYVLRDQPGTADQQSVKTNQATYAPSNDPIRVGLGKKRGRKAGIKAPLKSGANVQPPITDEDDLVDPNRPVTRAMSKKAQLDKTAKNN